MPSAINALQPTEGNALTSAVRANFLAAKNEIEALQNRSPHAPLANINGHLAIWQYGTTFTSLSTTPKYFADLWQYSGGGATGTYDIARDADVPTVNQCGIVAPASLKITCTIANTTIAPTNFATVYHYLEGHSAINIAQRPMTISVWLKTSIAGTYCISLRNAGSDRSHISDAVLPANAWSQILIQTTTPEAGTWDYTTGIGLRVAITLKCGNTYQTTTGAWQTGNYLISAAQTNLAANVGASLRIAMLQIQPGTLTAAEINSQLKVFPPYALELARCQRYYEPILYGIWSGSVTSGQTVYQHIRYKCSKRVNGTATLSPSGGNAGFPATAPTPDSYSLDSLRINHVANASLATAFFQYLGAVNAEL